MLHHRRSRRGTSCTPSCSAPQVLHEGAGRAPTSAQFLAGHTHVPGGERDQLDVRNS
ncbi:hypothetical protein HBB16_04590 [Pseudonocardia sp. MCCB 268]|nr:hypothetical protein [Pseudonocardia cytotoxica]